VRGPKVRGPKVRGSQGSRACRGEALRTRRRMRRCEGRPGFSPAIETVAPYFSSEIMPARITYASTGAVASRRCGASRLTSIRSVEDVPPRGGESRRGSGGRSIFRGSWFDRCSGRSQPGSVRRVVPGEGQGTRQGAPRRVSPRGPGFHLRLGYGEQVGPGGRVEGCSRTLSRGRGDAEARRQEWKRCPARMSGWAPKRVARRWLGPG